MFLLHEDMKGNRLYKCEKLCSRTAINGLFASGRSVVAYPLRAVVAVKEAEPARVASARFMITVPKKKIRTALGRVLLRRRIREAYRLNRPLLLPRLAAAGQEVDIAFLYMANTIADYAKVESAMKTVLGKIAALAETCSQPPVEAKEVTDD